MEFRPTTIPEVILVEPDVHQDDRGFFLETYHREKYTAGGITAGLYSWSFARRSRHSLPFLHLRSPPRP